ncbi:MAG: zinc-binding dehydrogenase [Cyclobacteriaceae bacterium]|nr:zinc-binding dehydrogenase [Cyclobacteriaceae bacterium HetDA_MAG_MS6]
MKAICITEQQEPLQVVDKKVPKPDLGQCLIQVVYAGLNRRDQWIRQGLYPGIKTGVTLGSDGSGTVIEAPGNTSLIGQKVLFNPNVEWGKDQKAPGPSYSILGMPTDGTLAEYIVLPAEKLFPIPDHLSMAEAAALPLAGLTAYRACSFKGNIQPGQHVLVTGAGGGVAQLVMAFALARGCEVYVTSGSEEKIERCKSLGVPEGFLYHHENWTKEALHETGGFDVIIDSAGGGSVNNYLKVIRPGGKIVVYGGTTGKTPQFDVHRLFWSQASIVGSSMGSDQEFEQMLSFVSQHQIRPIINEMYAFDDYIPAFDRFQEPGHFGKILLQIAS